MTYNILRILVIVLPFILVPNKVDCFRSVKETVFQLGAIALIAASFFDTKVRAYSNKYLAYFIAYITILFFRTFSISYIWGNDQYRAIINSWNLLPMFNVILALIMIKMICENITREQLEKLVDLVCFATLVVSLHLICQRFDIVQIYGRSTSFLDKNHWVAGNRCIAFIGNPMIAATYVAMAAQFNLFFKDKKHFIFYAIAFVACCCTLSASAIGAFLVCATLFFLANYLWVGLLIMLVSFASLIYIAEHFTEFFSFSDRLLTWQKTVELWWQTPYTGTGFGSFKIRNLYINSTHWWQVHNEYLQVLMETGLIGLGLLLLVIIDFFKRNWREVGCLVVLCGVMCSILGFPLHIAPTAFILILGFCFCEVKDDILQSTEVGNGKYL